VWYFLLFQTVWYFLVFQTVWYLFVFQTVWYLFVFQTVWYLRIVQTVWYLFFFQTGWYLFVFHFITIKYKVSTWVAQQAPLMKQDNITLPDHLSLALVFSGVCVDQSLILQCSLLWTITFRLVIVISALFRHMDSGYLCGMYAIYTSNYYS
jgi:hypothetical protein